MQMAFSINTEFHFATSDTINEILFDTKLFSKTWIVSHHSWGTEVHPRTFWRQLCE